MKRSHLLIILAVLLSVSLACNFTNRIAQPSESPPSAEPLEIEPIQPPEEIPTEPPTLVPPTEYPTVHPTITAQPPTPTTETVVSPFVPTGFLAVTGDNNSLTVYNVQGQAVGVVQSPGLNAGGLATHVISIPSYFL